MSFEVGLPRFEGGAAEFGLDERTFERLQINAVNRTASWARRALLVEPFSRATGVRRVIFQDRIRLNRATTASPEARIVPSSAGIPARCYRHRADPVGGSRVRARVLVAWWRGEKVAAGFINPEGQRKLPLATRSVKERQVRSTSRNPNVRQYRYDYSTPRNALGPSAAALFKVAVDDRTHEQVAERLAEEFNRDLDKELF